MKPLYAFGISQEDPSIEEQVLALEDGDSVLCIASGGEVPLSLLVSKKNIKILSVDISPEQIFLTHLKQLAAMYLQTPLNGQFLGYGKLKGADRVDIHNSILVNHLEKSEIDFWNKNLHAIERGLINAGKFELYIKRLRFLARSIIGRKNIERLLLANSTDEQLEVFEEHIANRRLVKDLFKVAFHPYVYKRRGLNETALQHASADTGEKFFLRFKEFCTSTPAHLNFYFQYILTGSCEKEAYPRYLQEENKSVLKDNAINLRLENLSIEQAIDNCAVGEFNKIHLSNIGDWMTTSEFSGVMNKCYKKLQKGSRLCYRYLHKNHFETGWNMNFNSKPAPASIHVDQFPFYSVLLLEPLYEFIPV